MRQGGAGDAERRSSRSAHELGRKQVDDALRVRTEVSPVVADGKVLIGVCVWQNYNDADVHPGTGPRGAALGELGSR